MGQDQTWVATALNKKNKNKNKLTFKQTTTKLFCTAFNALIKITPNFDKLNNLTTLQIVFKINLFWVMYDFDAEMWVTRKEVKKSE